MNRGNSRNGGRRNRSMNMDKENDKQTHEKRVEDGGNSTVDDRKRKRRSRNGSRMKRSWRGKARDGREPAASHTQ